jgi:Cu(I)/Ag(I) efflux system membrane fusion protein
MGCFNVMQGQSTLIKMNQPIRFSSEFDQNDFINAKVDFIEHNSAKRIRQTGSECI